MCFDVVLTTPEWLTRCGLRGMASESRCFKLKPLLQAIPLPRPRAEDMDLVAGACLLSACARGKLWAEAVRGKSSLFDW